MPSWDRGVMKPKQNYPRAGARSQCHSRELSSRLAHSSSGVCMQRRKLLSMCARSRDHVGRKRAIPLPRHDLHPTSRRSNTIATSSPPPGGGLFATKLQMWILGPRGWAGSSVRRFDHPRRGRRPAWVKSGGPTPLGHDCGEHKRPHGQISVEVQPDSAISLWCYSYGESNSVGSGVVYSPADAALVTEALKLPGPTCVDLACIKVQFLK